ncbi:SUMF1/EgtB/PvdO family nonheme iron enzyme [bacterium]|nr:SUMF1/EgtB/PvdO family nonheme iron enzyme [bacterium]
MIFLISLLLPLSLQAVKPDAALKPVTAMGDMSASQETMIYNQLKSQLSSNYQLIPKATFEKAMEKVAEEMESDQCTEEYCIRKIQEILQVDRLFALMIIQDDTIIQLTLELDRAKGKLVKSDTCEKCGIKELMSKIKALTAAIMADDLGTGAANNQAVQFTTSGTSGTSAGVAKIERIVPKTSGDSGSEVSALFLDSDPSDADVYLGSYKSGKTPYQNMSLKAGQDIRITLKKGDYHDKILDLSLVGGTNELDTQILIPMFGSLTITSSPSGADVWLAGEKAGVTPFNNNRVSSGSYLLSLRYPLYRPLENQPINIVDGQAFSRHFALEADFGTLAITPNPSDAEIQINKPDGATVHQSTGKSSINLKQGDYKLKLTKSGYAPLEFNITIERNKELNLRDADATLRALQGGLIVSSQPYRKGASVFVDSQQKGKVPATLTLPSGTHLIEIKSSGESGSAEVTIVDGKTITVTIPLKKSGETGMVLIPAGEFEMGSENGEKDEKPVHTVYLDAFQIDTFEVTVEQYKKCARAGDCEVANTNFWSGKHQEEYDTYCNYDKTDRNNHPINCVDWKNATAYCQFINKRLPTEAEWERAATWKNGQKYNYPSGKSSVSCDDAVMLESGSWDKNGGCGRVSTWPVGGKPVEINGTHDMAGNVWEWVSDWYGSYPGGVQRNPKGASSGSDRVDRGGSWVNESSYLRGSFRDGNSPTSRYADLGFRCASSAP